MRRRWSTLLAMLMAIAALPSAPFVAPVAAGTVPPNFTDNVAWSGFVNPTVLQFAPDGRIYVAEKSGLIKVLDNLADPSASLVADLRTNVMNYWDRGLLGMVVDPGFPTQPYLYVLYTYDHILGQGGSAPRWGVAGQTGDSCPTPPGPTTDGCVVSARLSRLTLGTDGLMSSEQVLVEDWCQQFPSHSIGTLAFGPEGALYVSGGDGASFTTADYGQLGGTQTQGPDFTQVNPCGDPPNPAGTPLAPPSAEGGALRSQDMRTLGTVSGGPDYASVVLADAPDAYYRLGESSGLSAVDQVAARNGTFVGGPTLGVPGALVNDADKALRLDGVDDRVSVPDADVFSVTRTGKLTLEAWVRPATDSGGGGIIIGKGTVGNYEYAIDRDGSGFHAVMWSGPGNTRISLWTPSDYPKNVWHHVVVTIDNNVALRIYVDGAQAAFSTIFSNTSSNGTSPFEIGRRPDNQQYFLGDVDEVATYGRVLTATEVSEHYQAGLTGGGGGTSTDPVGLDGTILRLDPATGLGWAGNPFSGPDDNARRIIAYGLRNPFRFTFRPGTSELWLGDVGYNTWEEINRIQTAAAPAENFGWPCYEGVGRLSGYDNLNVAICENLYTEGTGAVTAPYFTYNHSSQVVTGETCPTGSSAVAGLQFYPTAGGPYPSTYAGALFFVDNSRDCIWAMRRGANGLPDTAQISTFVAGAANPVDLKLGPNGLLYYVDFDGGTIHRIDYAGAGNQPPTAVINASPTSGTAPLAVHFTSTGSSDPESGALTYAWDLDADGQFDDGTAATADWTYQTSGTVTAVLRVTDPVGASDTDSVVITAGTPNQPPAPVISTPAANAPPWVVGQTISFSGSATDPEDVTIPSSRLSWSLVLQHCPSNCHTHQIQTWDGVANGSFVAPDHDYPSYLELTLTATDSQGKTASVTRRLDPQTVVLSFATAPTGLSLGVDASTQATPFTRTVIVGSAHSISAAASQSLNGTGYSFTSWSDVGARVHTITAPATATTYTATYTQTTRTITPLADAETRQNQAGKNFGASTTMQVRGGNNAYRSYVMFDVTGLTGPASNAKLRLWVTDPSAASIGLYQLTNTTWTETGITWNNAPALPGSTYRTFTAPTTGAWVEIDLGTLVTGNGRYAFAISGGSTDVAVFQSKEGANDPQLVVTLP